VPVLACDAHRAYLAIEIIQVVRIHPATTGAKMRATRQKSREVDFPLRLYF
jgi:hypothetical protein